MGEIIGKCITILKETSEWKGRIGVTGMEGIMIVDIEDRVPINTHSSGWGLRAILISIGSCNTRDPKKRRVVNYQQLLNFSRNPRKKEKEVSIRRTPAFIPRGLCEGRHW